MRLVAMMSSRRAKTIAGGAVVAMLGMVSFVPASRGEAQRPAASSGNAVKVEKENGAGAERGNGSSFDAQEAEAMSFVEKHHPELVSLLQLLKAMQEKEYHNAIREIVKVNKRLELAANRNPELHAIELEEWKLQSKIDLLVARGVAKDKSFDPDELKKLLRSQVENQKKRLKYERNVVRERDKALTDSIKRIEGEEDNRVSQQFALLMKRVEGRSAKPSKNKSDTKVRTTAPSTKVEITP